MGEKKTPATEYSEVIGLLTQIGHDIRTPMNTILGSTELILHEDVSAKVRESVSSIRHAANLLSMLADDVMELIRISNGQLKVAEEEYCFMDVTLDVRKHLENSTRSKGLIAEFDIDDNIPYRMIGDRKRITDMLEKLIDNACESTRDGAVTFTAKCMEGVGNSVFLRFDVSDSSKQGLSEDLIEVLSGRPLSENHSTRSAESAAIRACIIRHFASAMGGKLTARVQRGRGCVFTLLIAQQTVGIGTIADHIESEEMASSEVIPFTAEDARALIVDDNLINAKIESCIIERYAINCDIVDNGPDAIDLVKKIKYDLIFMDHMMPGMDGVDVTKAIRALAVDLADDCYLSIPIIAFTANTGEGVVEMLLSEGMNDYLAKPVDVDELERVICKWLTSDKIKYLTAASYEGQGISALEQLGLNTRLGLANFGGNEEEYKDILTTMCRSSDTKGKIINHYIEQHDYKNFIVAMHGILGVAQMIGAEMLAGRAKELEHAAKKGLTDVIEREAPVFADDFDRLLSAIRSVIMPPDNTAVKGLIDKDDLKKILLELRGYLSDYQIDEVEELFYKLAQFSYPDDEIVNTIHVAEEHMLGYNYNDVIDDIDSILARLEET